MDLYAPGWLLDVDNIRVLITQIGFVATAVSTPGSDVRLWPWLRTKKMAYLQYQTR